jgi:DNA-directed RNA polymerase subunit RPC12/RpoP
MYRWIGAILVGLGLFFVMVAIVGGTVANEDMDASSEQYFGIAVFCTVVLMVPGFIIFAWGYKLGQKEREYERLAGYLKSYRRIKISDVATKIGKSEMETEQLIAKIVEKGLILGYIDRNSREFFTHQSLFHEVDRPDKCPNCGASMYTRVLSGENAVCDYCGAHFSTKHNLQPPPVQGPQVVHPGGMYYTSPQYPPPPPPPPPTYPVPPPKRTSGFQEKPNMTTVKCPSCAKLFDIQKQQGTFRISCPYCGAKGMMKG